MLNTQNLQNYHRVDYDKFNHLDFLFAIDVVPLLYQPAIHFMNNH